jgi:hypothetical protein
MHAVTLICLGYSGMWCSSKSPPGQPHVRKLLLKHVLFVFLSAFFSVLRIVPKTFFRVRSAAVPAIFSAVAFSLAAHAQTSEWTWMGGSSIFTEQSNGEPGQPGVYGTQGQPSAANIPGGRLGAVSWTDKDGNFWLFGGGGLDSTETFGFLNDLWEFNPSTGEWTWVSGGNTIAVFNGGQPGIYGQKGTPSATNTPGARTGALGWTDANGNLWLFGGTGFDAAGTNGNLNDLWEFNLSTREWTWVGGSSNLASNGTVAGVYGTLGSLTAGSFPGSRNNGVAWTSKDGSLWLFGGYGGSTLAQFGALNDLWRYVPSTNQWAWLGGSSTYSQPGVYGQPGTPAPANVPGARVGSAAGNIPGSRDSGVGWTDIYGNFWLFGGDGSDAKGMVIGYLNDLWEHLPVTATPTLSLVSGTYATARTVTISDATPDAAIYYTTDASIPTTSSAKYIGPITVSSTETIHAIATATGYANSALASAMYTLGVTAAMPTFSPAAGTYTTAQTVTINDATPGALIYYTTDGTTPTTSSAKYTSAIAVSSTETIRAIVAATNYLNSGVASATYTIQPPPTFVFTGSPTSLTVASGSQGTVMLTVTPQNGFNSTVSFACTGLQPSVSCTFSPATVTPSGTGAVTTQLTLSTSTETSALRWSSHSLFPAAPLALAVGFLWLGKRRRLWMVLLLAMAFAGAGMLTACGGGSPAAPNVPVTSTVTVNATSGSIQQAATVTLTVN